MNLAEGLLAALLIISVVCSKPGLFSLETRLFCFILVLIIFGLLWVGISPGIILLVVLVIGIPMALWLSQVSTVQFERGLTWLLEGVIGRWLGTIIILTDRYFKRLRRLMYKGNKL